MPPSASVAAIRPARFELLESAQRKSARYFASAEAAASNRGVATARGVGRGVGRHCFCGARAESPQMLGERLERVVLADYYSYY